MPSVKPMPKEANTKKATASKTSPKKNSQPQALSTEYMQDSQSEGDDSSDANSSSDDVSLPENPATIKLKKNSQAKIQVSESSSSSGSEDDSESESEDESSSEESEDEQVSSGLDKTKHTVRSSHQRDVQKSSNTKTVSVEKIPAYRPPSGFEPASIDEAPRISQLLTGPNLEGKEIWYITAPASVALSSIEGLSMQAIQEREQIVSHNGDGYAFVPDANEANGFTKVMVPNSSNDGYHTGKTSISRTIHLQQTIPRSKFASQVTTSAKKPVRQQPKGLKVRYHPIGFGPERTGSGSSDQEMLDTPAAEFRRVGSTSSSSDSSKDEDLDSDTALSHSKSRTKSKPLAVESTKTDDRPTKSKHKEGEKKKLKHNSSNSVTVMDDRKLKRIKKGGGAV